MRVSVARAESGWMAEVAWPSTRGITMQASRSGWNHRRQLRVSVLAPFGPIRYLAAAWVALGSSAASVRILPSREPCDVLKNAVCVDHERKMLERVRQGTEVGMASCDLLRAGEVV